MLDYWVRLYRLYQQPIEQVIIFLQPTTSKKVFEDSFRVGNTIHRYRIIRLWECEAKPLLQIPELLPLAVLAKSENPSILLSQISERIDTIKDIRKRSNIAACVELLAGINFSAELIAMYLQEDILKESVIYKKILNEGLKQGEQRGESSLIIRQLSRRFGTIERSAQERIRQLSVPQLEVLGESLLDFSSLNDLLSWLENVNA
jgi:predicted transposase YdaD